MHTPPPLNPNSTPTASLSHPHSIYSRPQKWLLITLASLAASLSGLASNIYFPSLPTISTDLSVSQTLINLSITSYMVLQALSPPLWAALSDVHGRRLTYLLTLSLFLAACVALAETRNYATLVTLRCVQSAGSAATIAVGSGVVGDVTTKSERGGFMGVFTAGLLVPLAVGPVIGGVLSDKLGWRSVFWFLTAYGGIVLLGLVVLLPETLRCRVGNGSVGGQGWVRRWPLSVYQKRWLKREGGICEKAEELPNGRRVDVVGSLKVLVDRRATPIIAVLAIHYTTWQMSLTALPNLLKTDYGLDDTQIGFTYIANGVGSMLGAITTGKLLDRDFQRLKARSQSSGARFHLDHARLRSIWIWSGMQMASLLIFGWTLDQYVHISVPIIASSFTGWGAMSIQSMVSTYLVDLFLEQSASASAALNLARCLLGAGGTAAVTPILDAIGVGWGFTMLVAILGASLGLERLNLRWRSRRGRRGYCRQDEVID